MPTSIPQPLEVSRVISKELSQLATPFTHLVLPYWISPHGLVPCNNVNQKGDYHIVTPSHLGTELRGHSHLRPCILWNCTAFSISLAPN